MTTTGITFTFGGLQINDRGEVQDVTDRSIPGLYAAGELVGGLFYENYPGGSGLKGLSDRLIHLVGMALPNIRPPTAAFGNI